jgi:hypothetical protein
MSNSTTKDRLITGSSRASCNRSRVLLLSRLFILPTVYIAAALKISYDTGYAPWEWQFLAMFLPVVLLGEQVIKEFTHRFSDA